MGYLDEVNDEIKEYYKMLSTEIPEFLYGYIDTKAMRRIGKISCWCGTDLTNVFENKYPYSNLEHSIAVALIVWNFTKDKKQTLAGLFHDIATPTFKHCIDFMNGDYEKQESTEEQTREIIENSEEIMALLKRDNVKVEEVMDYHIYPIADNDTPKLSSDRLEYTFTNGIYFDKPVWDLNTIKEIYEDIEILTNEDNIQELGFKNIEIAEKFIEGASKLWPKWISNEDKTTMQFIADIVREMNKNGLLEIKDLYKYSEKEIVQKIKNCGIPRIQEGFDKFQKATRVYGSDKPVPNKYCVSIEAKRRYIIPLVKQKDKARRITEVSKEAKEIIEKYLNHKTEKYSYFDFNF